MKFIENKYFLLIILAMIWGTSFILIKKSVEVFSPYQVGALRVGIAGLALMVFGIPSLRKLDKKTIFWATVGGCLGNFIPMFLFPIAEVKVSSSLAGVLNSLVPIFVLIFGYLFFKNKTTKVQVIGAVFGFIGASLLMYFSSGSGENSNLSYAMLIVLACISYAFNGLITKEKLSHVKSFDLGGIIFTIWSIPSFFVLIFSNFFSEFKGTPEQWEGLGYISILSLIGTATAMILFYKLIQQTTTVFASSVTYLIPIVAVAWGFLDGELFNIWFVIGGILILFGIYLIKQKPKVENL